MKKGIRYARKAFPHFRKALRANPVYLELAQWYLDRGYDVYHDEFIRIKRIMVQCWMCLWL